MSTGKLDRRRLGRLAALLGAWGTAALRTRSGWRRVAEHLDRPDAT